jgi:hypothetical protein
MFRRLSAPSTPFYTPNLLHVDYSVVTIPANRKTHSFKFRRTLCYFVPDVDVSTFKCSFHTILHAERIACRLQWRDNPCKSQNAIFQISTNTLLFRSWFEIPRHSNALSTPSYTPIVLHVDLSVETFPANRKTQSFKLRGKPFYFVPDLDVSTFKCSFHTILHAERIACRFQCRNNPCKSQNAIFQISTNTLLFRSWLRYYGI